MQIYRPIAQSTIIVNPSFKPSIINYKHFHTQAFSGCSQSQLIFFIHIKCSCIPAIVKYRPFFIFCIFWHYQFLFVSGKVMGNAFLSLCCISDNKFRCYKMFRWFQVPPGIPEINTTNNLQFAFWCLIKVKAPISTVLQGSKP